MKTENLYTLTKILINGVKFSEPILVIYLLQFISLGEILFYNSLKHLMIVLTEIPTSIITDKLNQKNSIIISSVLNIAAYSLILIPHTLPILISFLLMGIAQSFITGSTESLLYESLNKKSEKNENKIVSAFGETRIRTNLVSNITLFLSGLIAKISLLTNILLTIIQWLAVLTLAIFYPEPVKKNKKKKENYLLILKKFLKQVLSSKELILSLILSSLIYASYYVSLLYDQPLMRRAGIDITLFGLIYVTLNTANNFGNRLADELNNHFSGKTLFTTSILINALALTGLAITHNPLIIITLLIFNYAVEGVATPNLFLYLNKFYKGEYRSSLLSLDSLLKSIIIIIFSSMLGIVNNLYGLTASLLIVSTILISLVPIIFWKSKF